MNNEELIAAMLDAGLDGNAMKVLIAYRVKSVEQGQESSYLPKKDHEGYGMSRATLFRHRKELIEKGWLVASGEKSWEGYDCYEVRIPRRGGRG